MAKKKAPEPSSGHAVPVVKKITSDGRLIYDVASIISSEAGKKHIDSLIENTLPNSKQPE